jgi:hypothetical protein
MPLPLFFTYNTSLRAGKRNGMRERELALYRKYIEKGVRVSFISDGRQDKKLYPEKPQGIEILCNEFRLPSRYEEHPIPLIEVKAAGAAISCGLEAPKRNDFAAQLPLLKRFMNLGE